MKNEQLTIEQQNGIHKEFFQMDLNMLKKAIPVRWRVQQIKNDKAICVPYIDSRDAQDLLDEVCTPAYWQDDYKMLNNKLYAGVGIRIHGEWIWKWGVGTESNIEKEKGEESDAFKRACVKWGIGRFLYQKNPVVIPAKDNKPYCEEKKSVLYSGDALSNYINWRITNGKS